MLRRRLDIGHHLGVIELHAIAAATVDIVLRVAELDAFLDAVEQRWRAHRVALPGKAIAHVADVVLTPKISWMTTSPLAPADGPAV